MATGYGDWAAGDDWRAVVEATVTNDSNGTTCTVKVVGKFQNVYAVSTSSNWTAQVTSGASSTNSTSFGNFSGAQTITVKANTFTVSRTHAAQTITCRCRVTTTQSTYSSYSSEATVTVTIPAKASYTVAYNANSGTGAPSSQTKWHGEALTLSSTVPTRTGYTFGNSSGKWHATGGDTGWYDPGDTYTANVSTTLYAAWTVITYTVAYNANGGSGAPSSQTKTYGKTLTLSSTKPTRTGYTFSGWNTKSDGSGTSYSAGGSYTANAAATLHAQWTAVTYTVKYAANGGSSTPSSQTKTHGVALTLRAAISRASAATTYTVSFDANGGSCSTATKTATKTTTYAFAGWKSTAGTTYNASASYTANAATTMTAQWTSSTSTSSVTLPTPTRSGYSFDGWYTASSGGTRVGGAGSSYTPSASIQLHAQWTQSYTAPTLSKLTAIRTDSSGTADDEGTYCKATVTWKAGSAAITRVTVTASAGSVSETATASSPSGTSATLTFGSGNLDKDTRYTVTATITDGTTTLRKTTVLSPAFFTLDFLKGGRGIAIGQAASAAGFAVNIVTTFFKNVVLSGVNLYINSASLTRGTTVTENTAGNLVQFRDSAGTNVGQVGTYFGTGGREGVRLGTARTVDGSSIAHWLYMYINAAGTRTVSFSDPEAWRAGLGIGGTVITNDISTNVSTTSGSYAELGNVTLSEGTWLIHCNCYFASNATGRRYMVLHDASATASTASLRARSVTQDATNGAVTTMNGTFTIEETTDRTWYLNVWQNSGGALNATGFIRAIRLT